MNSKLDLGQQALLKKIDNKIIYKLISVMKLPMVLISGIKIDSITEEICSTSVRYRYINKNPFNSTYFAVLSMAAELSTGALALLSAGGVNSDISFIITGMEAKFVKKAKGRTTFICKQGHELLDAAVEARKKPESQSQAVKTEGYNEEGELVAEFKFTWSFRKRKGT
mgnify:FL=1